jgi:transcriptional regulator with PAS, ATPase and Fis domain
MHVPKILAIAPYEGMKEAMLSVAKNRTDLELSVFIGNLQGGLDIVNSINQEDYDVIISRGGTVELIGRSVDKPVIEIEISVYDVLRTIKLAENYNDKFAVAGYPSITKSAQTLCDLLNYDIDIFTFDDATDVQQTLLGLKDKGYGMILSDVIGYMIADEIGLNAILITSGIDSIESAFNQAKGLVKNLNSIIHNQNLYKAIIDYSYDHNIILDDNYELWHTSTNNQDLFSDYLEFINKNASKLIHSDTNLFERKFDDFISKIHLHTIILDDKTYYSFNIKTDFNPVVAKDNSIRVLSKIDLNGDDASSYASSLSFTGDVKQQVEEFSTTDDPIIILGESGTGKDTIAHAIYRFSKHSKNNLYTIDCTNMEDKSWDYLINSDNSPLYSVDVTIYFKHANNLSLLRTKELINVLSYSNPHEQNRLIFSFALDNTDLEKSQFYSFLTNKLMCVILTLPPLREKAVDIPNISTLYLNQLNASLGKEVVGINPKAMEHLKNYSWPHNYEQFKRILRQLVIITSSPYIKEDDVIKTLKKEKLMRPLHNVPGTAMINIEQSLEEINYDIIQQILQEDGMNQIKAAERLGVSRSTIWRILKSNS